MNRLQSVGESHWIIRAVVVVFVFSSIAYAASTADTRPTGLKCDSLVRPLGIDTANPLLSWQLQDKAWGAKQTAYEIMVSSKPDASAKADVWDSGRVSSEQSVDVPYAGPRLEAEKRYYWRVKVWGKDGKPYPASATSWWEMGLLTQDAWKGKWISYEAPELHSIREAGAIWITNPAVPNFTSPGDTHHDFRFSFDLRQTIKRAVLYTTGQDTAAAWVNGEQVLEAKPLTPWKQMPWGTYVSKEITSNLHQGKNQLAIGITHFNLQGGRAIQTETQTPMSMCLYLVMADGSVNVLTSASSGWKAALDARGDWFSTQFDDSSWKSAEPFTPKSAEAGGSPLGDPWPTGPVTLLRRAFAVSKPIASARLYATALGAYKFHINGKPVGDQILAPGWMDFREHVPYQVYDVTSQIVAGKNAIAAYLAPGWYSTPLMWFRQGNNYGSTPPALKAQLRIEHNDGSVEWISTDDSWKADLSAILSAEIYDGETYDARLVQPGWDTASFADARWKPVTLVTPKEPQIVAQYFQPIREEKVMIAKSISSPAPGVYIYDFGQNLSGVPRVRIKGRRGQDIKLRFAEVLNPDGTMYVENLRTAKATDHFILAGTGGESGETYQPQFTYHGFRYLEVTGLDAKPALDAIKTVVFHTDAPFTSRFETGNKMVNQLWANILWGQRSNFIGVPTDCPQRDERLGWSADAQVFWRTAAYNMDLDAFTQKYASDLRGTQVGTPMYGIFAPGTITPNPGFGTGWSDAGVIIPWTGWIQSGDKRIIEQNWDAMEKYLAAIQKQNPDYLWRNGFGTPFGDWLTPTQTTPEDLIATAYWAYDVSLMKDMATASGRSAEAAKYGDLFEQIKAAFAKAYVRSDGFVGTVDHYPSIPPPTISSDVQSDKTKSIVETQTGYVLALHMNLIPDELRAAAAEKLVKKIQDNHWLLGTGFLGTPYLLEVLSDTGHSDVAYRLLLNTSYPSWGYLIEHGATTMWERWNGDQMRGDPSMNSYNHYAYGAVAEWMYRYAAGIDTVASDPGFHTIYLHPNFDARIGNLNFAYDSPYGTVSSNWKINGADAVWNVTIPPNATAVLPLTSTKMYSMMLDGKPLASNDKIHLEENAYRLPSGTYSFKISMNAFNGSVPN
ncbi:family 78 glycoside hydrolase catalytic domain [Edaphobacter paludis]|uniref:alpha-L-rhamnosidase n=1 Tax=Edaphobacter paludis TaxID=3035702 RepID=A0AAU7D768_9BACT